MCLWYLADVTVIPSPALSHPAEVSFHGQGAIDDDGTAQTDDGKGSTEITVIAVAIFAIALVLVCLAAVRSR